MSIKHFNKLIDDVVKEITIGKRTSPSDTTLVGFTFYVETGMYDSDYMDYYSNRNGVRGMMNMKEEDIKWLILDHIKPKQTTNALFKDYAGIDLRNMSLAQTYRAADYNIAFQVLLTYFWYFYREGKIDSIEDIVSVYIEHWNGLNDDKSHDFVKELLTDYTREVHR